MDDDLEATFERFRTDRAKLEELLNDVKKAYKDSSKIKLSKDVDIERMLLSSEKENEVRRVFQDPKLVVTGETNSGKTSLINEILGATVLKVDDLPCTSRITELAYGPNERPIITILKKDGSVETKTLKTTYIPSGIVDLSEEQKDDEELTGAKVYVQMNNAFLRSGVRIVDSPGKNENKTLDKLVDDHMGSVLPLVVYVIDGLNMLGEQDIEDINYLDQTIPHGNVFFAVTKCDDLENDDVRSDEESDSEDDEPGVNRRLNPTRQEKEIRQEVYKKLVDNGFLENVAIEECKYYHTLSSRYVKKYRKALVERTTNLTTLEEWERFMTNFRKFKASLLAFTKKQLVQTVIDATKIIQISLVIHLDYFVGDFDKAREQSISDGQNIEKLNRKLQNMELIESKEVTLWNGIQSKVQGAKEEYIAAAEEIIHNKRDEILKLAKEIEVEKFKVPKSGRVDPDVLSQRAADLAEKIMNKVGIMIHKEVKSKHLVMARLFEDISDLVKKLQDEMEVTSEKHDVLKLVLTTQYKVDVVLMERSLCERVLDFLKSIVSRIFRVKFDFEKWRLTVVKELLEVIDTDKLADTVMAGTLTHFTKAHEGFCKQLKSMRTMKQAQLKSFRENTRELEFGALRQTPRIGRLLVRAWDIQDRLRFRRLNRGEIPAGGSRSVIYECDARGPRDELCAVKLIRLKNLEEVGEVGLRLHCYRQIDCDYLAEVFCVQYSECIRENVYELSILMPRFERNLLNTLPEISSLKDRLLIGRQVSEALACIHKENLMHGNMSCTNVMLNADNRVRITDSIDAPEMYTRPRTTKMDVHAFGIILFCICKGEGISGTINQLVRFPEMRDDCWALIAKCLNTEPSARPTMEEVTRELIRIISVVSCHWK